MADEVEVEIIEDEINIEVSCISSASSFNSYSTTADLTALSVTSVTTTITTYPYSIMVCDASDNLITSLLQIRFSLAGGVYVLNIYSVDNLASVKIKVLW